jgi:hypothetical protein
VSNEGSKLLSEIFLSDFMFHFQLYWVAPISGAAAAAFFYRTVFGFKHEAHAPEPIPLQDPSEARMNKTTV